ncbi:HXXEE domain-containing protein [Streptomyces huiliensis]|uniref:HXXEE domain-containing protein n=1 Tax=Streptomyces huiliensis TaxID=2876027 RepID=UPI001CBCF334|nr:HXXEE domain-containing protein [Streptomyces huiliensis]MBZ4318278.1 HXXEE domain-containing protein [Streptomyces huiliensis]
MTERTAGTRPATLAPAAGHLAPAVTLGLLAAWAVHDAEELATMNRFVRTRVPALRARHPRVPERAWRAVESMGGREFPVAVAAVAVFIGAAAAEGHRTNGRSAFYQTALDGFGLHGLVHLAQAAATRGYTPGAVTTPLVVLPFTVWARGRLRRAGVLRPASPRRAAAGLAVAGAAAFGSHALARRVLRASGR